MLENTIKARDIKEWLDHNQISYQWQPKHENTVYHLASLFNPIDKGFYFSITHTCVLNSISDSLIIIPESQKELCNSKNEYLFIEKDDPQAIFYQLTSYVFGTKTSGIISCSAIIDDRVNLGSNVQIDDFTIIEAGCSIGDNVIIGSHCKIHSGSIIESNTRIESMSIIGTQGVAWVWNTDQTEKIIQPQLGGVHIGQNVFLGANSIIVRGSINENTTIGSNTLIAPGCRLGHGTKIGSNVHFANNVITGGNTLIGNYSFVGSSAVFRPKVKIHEKSIIGAGSVVVKSTSSPGKTLMGVPAKELESKKNPSGMPQPKK